MFNHQAEKLKPRVREKSVETLGKVLALYNAPRKNALLTRKETSVFLGVKVNTLAVWAMKNRGPAPILIGRCVRYRVLDLEAYITNNTMPR